MAESVSDLIQLALTVSVGVSIMIAGYRVVVRGMRAL